ncbi:MAG: hypothetical protein WCO52_04070 [bacterium]
MKSILKKTLSLAVGVVGMAAVVQAQPEVALVTRGGIPLDPAQYDSILIPFGGTPAKLLTDGTAFASVAGMGGTSAFTKWKLKDGAQVIPPLAGETLVALGDNGDIAGVYQVNVPTKGGAQTNGGLAGGIGAISYRTAPSTVNGVVSPGRPVKWPFRTIVGSPARMSRGILYLNTWGNNTVQPAMWLPGDTVLNALPMSDNADSAYVLNSSPNGKYAAGYEVIAGLPKARVWERAADGRHFLPRQLNTGTHPAYAADVADNGVVAVTVRDYPGASSHACRWEIVSGKILDLGPGIASATNGYDIVGNVPVTSASSAGAQTNGGTITTTYAAEWRQAGGPPVMLTKVTEPPSGEGAVWFTDATGIDGGGNVTVITDDNRTLFLDRR